MAPRPMSRPDHSQLASVNPTGSGFEAAGAPQMSDVYKQLLASNDSVALPWLRPSLFASRLKSVTLLGGSVPVHATMSDEHGVVVEGLSAALPALDCAPWHCECADMGDFYGLGPPPGLGRDSLGEFFGCAPAGAKHWWTTKNCTTADYARSAKHPGCGTGVPPKVPPEHNGLVLKIQF